MRATMRLERMLSALPLTLRAGPRLAGVLGVAAQELSGGERSIERAITLLLRARWPGLARGWKSPDDPLRTKHASELGRLAGLYGAEPLAGESSDRFRQRLREHVALLRRGLTTAPALLELAAALYLPDEAPTIGWEGDRASANFVARDATGDRRTVRIELVDNPPRRRSARLGGGDDADPPVDALWIDNQGLDPATPKLTLTAASIVSVPEVLHVESDLRLLYLGTLDPGDRLEVEPDRPATVNGRSAPAPIVLADPATFDELSSFFSYEVAVDGELRTRGARFSRADRWQPGASGFSLPCGPSQIRWRSIPRGELRRLLDHWPDRDRVVDSAYPVAPPPTSPRLRLDVDWQEAQAATFALRVPADVIPWHLREHPTLHWAALRAVVERGRGAGIRGLVELRPPPLREELTATTGLSIRARIELRDHLDVGESSRVAENPELTEGVFDASAFGRAFAEARPAAPRDGGDDVEGL